MEGIILSAGYGKGLEPITHTRHKALVPLLNTTLLEHQLHVLKEVGVKRVVVVVSYLKEQVVNAAHIYSKKLGIPIKVSEQGKPLGTADALLKALNDVIDEEFIVLYGDVYVNATDLRTLVATKGSVIGAFEVSSPDKYGVIITDSNGRVQRVVEKPSKPPSNLVNAGVYKFSRWIERYLENVQLSSRGEYELTDALNNASSSVSIKVLKLREWFEIGRPWKVIEINKRLLSRLDRSVVRGRVERGVVIKGNVVIEEDSEVLSGTYIIGPALIGKGAVIGPNAFIRPYTVVLGGSRIGFNVEVKESIVMENVHIAHQSYVGDSVVCENANLGAGTILANLRFDEGEVKVTVKGRLEGSGRRKIGGLIGGFVKTGVNVSVCPGKKVGAYSWIYPGVTVCEDVPPCTIYEGHGSMKRVKGLCNVDLNVWQ